MLQIAWKDAAIGGAFYWLVFGQFLWLAWGAFVSGFDSHIGALVGCVVTYLICVIGYLQDSRENPLGLMTKKTKKAIDDFLWNVKHYAGVPLVFCAVFFGLVFLLAGVLGFFLKKLGLG